MAFKTRVMLVEDEQTAREILGFYLGTLFDEVLVAKDGQEALETYVKNQEAHTLIDLILTDIRMPRMDGMEMIEAIRKLDNKQKFIIVSAHKEEELLFQSINLRVIGYFVKPLNVDNMMEILQKAKAEVLAEKETNTPAFKVTLNGTYTFDKENELLYEGETLVKLSKRELDLLKILLKHQGTIVTMDTCKLALWSDTSTSDATFRTVMKRLKDKIAEDDFIVSRKGQGYIIF